MYTKFYFDVLHDFGRNITSVENEITEYLRGFVVFFLDSFHICQATSMRLSYIIIDHNEIDFGIKCNHCLQSGYLSGSFTWNNIPPWIPVKDSLPKNRFDVAIIQELYQGEPFIEIDHSATIKSIFVLHQYEIAQI